MSQFQLVIVGGGGIARAHVAAARAMGDGVRIAAVVDPSEPARRATADAAGGAEAFADWDAFSASSAAERVRGLILCTPPSVRVPIVEAALQRGIAVLAEKPLAHTVADARTLAALAAQYPNAVTAVGYCHRFTPAIVEMKRRIAAGAIGRISRFENTFAAPLPRMKDHWMSDPAISGGGSFIDTGCHSLDLFLHLVGDGRVRGAVFHHAWPGRGESSATVLLGSRDGVAGVIQSGWSEPGRFIVTLVGTHGSISYDYDRATTLHVRASDGPEQAVEVAPHEVRFQRQLEAFLLAATGASPPIRPATFAEGLLAAERVEEARLASQPIEWQVARNII